MSESFYAGFWPMFLGMGVLLFFIIGMWVTLADNLSSWIRSWGEARKAIIDAQTRLEQAKTQNALAEKAASEAAYQHIVATHDQLARVRKEQRT